MSIKENIKALEFTVGDETTLEQLLWLYRDFFQEQCPVKLCSSLEEDELKQVIADCIVSQQQYQADVACFGN